jgi:hypothetical protein
MTKYVWRDTTHTLHTFLATATQFCAQRHPCTFQATHTFLATATGNNSHNSRIGVHWLNGYDVKATSKSLTQISRFVSNGLFLACILFRNGKGNAHIFRSLLVQWWANSKCWWVGLTFVSVDEKIIWNNTLDYSGMKIIDQKPKYLTKIGVVYLCRVKPCPSPCGRPLINQSS